MKETDRELLIEYTKWMLDPNIIKPTALIVTARGKDWQEGPNNFWHVSNEMLIDAFLNRVK